MSHRILARLLGLATAAVAATGGLVVVAPAAHAASPCTAPVVNKVLCENTQTTNVVPIDDVHVIANNDTIVGYPTNISVNVGATESFKIKTDSKNYTVNIYRLGWYGGNGARLVNTTQVTRSAAQSQPACYSDSTGLYDCGAWGVSASWTVPTTAVSGLYYAVFHRNDGGAEAGGENDTFFVVRDDSSHSDMLYQTSDPTWQAYNIYGDASNANSPGENSLYTGRGPGPGGSAWKVSYNRPLKGSGEENLPFNAEYPMIRWLEANGYDTTYIAGVDTDRYGATLLTNHKVFLSVGHDEYWSQNQFQNVSAAKAAGLNLAFFSGNEVFWKTRYENSYDGSNTTYRTLVCYKETKWSTKIDPNPQWTGSWRDPRGTGAGGAIAENSLIGQQFLMNGYRSDALQVPAAYGKMRLWRNTALATMNPGTTYTFANGTLGYEWDTYQDNGLQPPGVAKLSSTTVSALDGDYVLQNYGDVYAPGTLTHNITFYRDQTSHALVFAAGTVQWSWALDNYHSFSQDGVNTEDVRIKQATVNLFADMGVRAGSIQTGLAQTVASTDTTGPALAINNPTNPTVGSPVQLTGTVSDSGGQVAGVEVSVDGTTWHPATWQVGSTAWSYSFTPGTSGAVTVRVRGVDDSYNLAPPVSKAITVSPRACPCSLWSNTTVPGTPSANDSSVLELGLKFRSDVSGWVSGIRFYKGTGNTGTHTGTLWSSTGQSLATGTFTNETATGWQTLSFGTPVQIAANTTYVASYHTDTGHYAADGGYFSTKSTYNQPLTALQNGTDGSNGVYSVGPSAFPTDTFGAANYWVDLVFGTTRPADTQAPLVAATNPASNVSNVPLTVAPAATFNEPVSATGLTYTLSSAAGAVAGSVGLDATGTVATFTPSAQLAAGTKFTATVRATDVSGNQMAAAYSWSFTTGSPRPPACPCTIWDDFVQPQFLNTNDASAIDVGTKVRFDVNGYISGVRFYKGSQNTGTHTGSLWSATGTRLATGTFANESAQGWQTLTFSSPVQVAANTTYVVSYHTNVGFYSSTNGYFGSQGADYQSLHALKDGVDGGNGVYHYGATSAFPNSSYNAGNYWVDVLWTNSLTGDSTPPTVTATSPTDGTTNVSNPPSVTATFSEAINPSALTFTLADGGGAKIDSTITYNSTTKTATLVPKAKLGAGESYAVSIKAADVDGNMMTAAKTLTFTTSTTQTCPCSVFSAATIPTTPSTADSGSYTLGMRFTSAADQAVTAIKFYKGTGNTGTHVGSLWTSDGQLLASGTFANETATGWQTLTLATAVNITHGVTYVVSYSAPSGNYASDSSYFELGAATSVPLSAPATAAGSPNGVWGSGSTFPTNTYRGTNYWVDVVVGPPVSGAGAISTQTAGFTANGTIAGSRSAPTQNTQLPIEQPLAIIEQQKGRRTGRRR
jgi:methionine-rich copper-binding protein CopC